MVKPQGRLDFARRSGRPRHTARLRGALHTGLRLALFGAALVITPAPPLHADLAAPPADSAATSSEAVAAASASALVETGFVRLPHAGANPPAMLAPPEDAGDLGQWLDFKLRAHVDALPYRARLFYRSGLLMDQSGNREEALRLVHGAVELDPGYVAPHLTLAAWLLTSSPSQAILHYAIVLDIARKNFLMQLGVSANAIHLGVQAVVLGLVFAGLLIVILHQAELRHAWAERLSRTLSPVSARAWAWALLMIPFMVGLGPVLPTVLFLAILWPMLKRNERFVFVCLSLVLVTAPVTVAVLDRLGTPVRPGSPPYYGVARMERAPYRAADHERLRGLTNEHPGNPFVQFALGWTARRGGSIAESEQAYREVLKHWPEEDRTINNLGNVLAMQGRIDEAVDAYRRATEIHAGNAAAHFNYSQIMTQRFEFREATDALSRASALDFDMVKAFQAQQTNDGYMPLVEQWLPPRVFWAAMPAIDLSLRNAPSIPPLWRSRIELSGWAFSAASLAAIVLALAFGAWQHRGIPMHGCSNCGNVVCRRCAERRRERALCRKCASIEARAESADFGRVLLAQHRRQHQHGLHLVRTALATLIPGVGLLAFRRVAPALAIFVLSAGTASIWMGLGGHFPYEMTLHLPDETVPVPVLVTVTVLLYLVSLAGYFGNVARARAQAAYLSTPSRSRAAQVTERQSLEAA